jgi:pilus assembly protein CpaB
LKRSNRLVLLIGIFLAIVAFVLIALMLGNGDVGGGGGVRPSASPATAPVVVAARNVDLGATFVAADLATKDIPVDQKPADSYSDTSQVIGQIARAKVTSGQLITSVILNSSGSIQNIEVPAGFVGISVQVDQVTGVGTLIKPGDFVDVVTGFTTPEKVPLVIPDLGSGPDLYSYLKVDDGLFNHTTVKFLAQGIQVIGTLLPAPPPAQNTGGEQASTAPDGTTTTLNGQQQMVILAVTAQDAEVLKFAQMDGNLSLVLRSPRDCTTKPVDGGTYCPVVATTGMTLRRLVDDRGVLPPTVVQVIQPTPLPGTVPGKTPKP